LALHAIVGAVTRTPALPPLPESPNCRRTAITGRRRRRGYICDYKETSDRAENGDTLSRETKKRGESAELQQLLPPLLATTTLLAKLPAT